MPRRGGWDVGGSGGAMLVEREGRWGWRGMFGRLTCCCCREWVLFNGGFNGGVLNFVGAAKNEWQRKRMG